MTGAQEQHKWGEGEGEGRVGVKPEWRKSGEEMSFGKEDGEEFD